MTALEDRRAIIAGIDQAHAAGARLVPACDVAGISTRTLMRWRDETGEVQRDHRPDAIHPRPAHALSEEERAAVLRVANEPRFAELPPARIVPMLADEGVYLASESSFQRILREHDQNAHRGRAKAPTPGRTPTTHVAHGPGDVWCWDVTWLPSRVTGKWYYLYLILDLYSRKVVGHEVHEEETAEHAAALVKRTALVEGVHTAITRPVLHGDNGAVLKATTVLAMLHWLGIAPSYSRPRVSDDNAFVESLFRTAKYRPGFPADGMESLAEARQWAGDFVHWYNHDHRHSALRYVAPAQRHTGEDHVLLPARAELYQAARERHPRRWSGPTRNWTPIGAVTLNPARDTLATAPGSDMEEVDETKRLAA